MIYAQLNAEKIAIGLSDLAGEVTAPNMIQLDEYDTSIIGKKYDGGRWLDVPRPPASPPEPTQEELTNLALMEGIAGLYESQIALEDRMTTDNLTVMEGIAGLFEMQIGGM